VYGTGQKRKWRQNTRVLPDLPQYYYHTNFCELLDFVSSRYQHCFDERAQSFLDDFVTLPTPAQCAYVRLASRKGYVFSTEKLVYAEIEDLDAQLEHLRETGFAAGVCARSFPAWLTHLPKPELVEVMRTHIPKTHFKVAMKKADLVAIAQDCLDPALTICPTDRRYIVQAQRDPLRYIMFLYFGRIEDSLAPFTLRDLGLMRSHKFRQDYEARFDHQEDALSSYFYALALHDFDNQNERRIAELIDSVADWPEAECDEAQTSRDRLLRKLGRLSEKLGDKATALSLYQRSNTPKCNERAVRLQWSLGDKDDVKARLESMMDDPASDGELDFAQDFYARKFNKKRTSAMTDILRSGTSVLIDEAFKGSPERAMVTHFEREGYTVRWTENRVWKMLFGLLFWDEIYDADAALHNAFQRRPASLSDGTFYERYADRIETKLAKFNSPTRMVDLMRTVAAHHRRANGIFQWSGRTLETVQLLMACENATTIAPMLRTMAKDYRRTHDGFPDLMRVKANYHSFVEVKSEGDVLRRNQLTRIRQLRECGLDVEIYRVGWQVDPDQVYVVVDVETTGGRPPHHRMTEIGAVKIQNGEIIDRFQSLLNPDRHIPSNITRLTGISNEMVADAPHFADIADDFAVFMQGAIFCAHNVNFDYSFVSAEYERLDQWFRYPKLCTVQKMRQFYPGYPSYSLKNLCGEFEISLDTHHRALCDAEAAGELLKLINAKRIPQQVGSPDVA